MSIRVMTRVWELSRHRGSDLLLLLAIADFSDDEGRAYPSVPRLAIKCRTTPRHTNRILASLRDSGELVIAVGEGPKGTNLYRVITDSMRPKIGEPLTAASPLTATSALTPASSTPDAHVPKPLTPTSDESSLKRQEPPKKRRDARKALASYPIPEDFSVSDEVATWALERHHTRLDDRLDHFINWAKSTDRRYPNWTATFKRAVAGDWAGLNPAPRRQTFKEIDTANAIAKVQAWTGRQPRVVSVPGDIFECHTRVIDDSGDQ